MSLKDYAKMCCALLDIPVHNIQNDRNIIESLHVLFTLYSEFKSNQHFQQNNEM
jgi:intraflagellar transport protein 46